MNLLTWLGINTKHQGQHAAQGQRGKHSGTPAQAPKTPPRKSKTSPRLPKGN